MPRSRLSKPVRLASSVCVFRSNISLIFVLFLSFACVSSSTLHNARTNPCQDSYIVCPARHSAKSNISRCCTLQPAASALSFEADLPGKSSIFSGCVSGTPRASPSFHSLRTSSFPSSTSTSGAGFSSLLDFHCFSPLFSPHPVQKLTGIWRCCLHSDPLHPWYNSIVADVRSRWPSAALILNMQDADPHISFLPKRGTCFPRVYKHHTGRQTGREPVLGRHFSSCSSHKGAYRLAGIRARQSDTKASLTSTRLAHHAVNHLPLCSLLPRWLRTEQQRHGNQKSEIQNRTTASRGRKSHNLSKGSLAEAAAEADAAEADRLSEESEEAVKKRNRGAVGKPNASPALNSWASSLLTTLGKTNGSTKTIPRVSVCPENGSSALFSLALPRRRSSTSVASVFSSSLRQVRVDRNASTKDYAIISIPVEVALHPIIFETLCSLTDTLERFERTLLITATSAATALGLAIALPRLVELEKTGVLHHSTAAAVGILLLPLCFAVIFTWLTAHKQKEQKMNGASQQQSNPT